MRTISVFAFLWLAFAASHLTAAEKPAMTPLSGTLSFLRLTTGPDGISHWVEDQVPLKARGTQGIDAVMAVGLLGDVKNAVFAMLKAGETEDWHPAPRRQFMVCLRGLVEVTAGDGQKRRVKPGEFVLLEDTSGKGHVTHAAGSEDHVALALPVPDGAFVRK